MTATLTGTNVFIDTVTGDDTYAGTRRKPLATFAQAVTNGLVPGDCVWVRGTLLEEVSIPNGVTIRNWGLARFVIDAASTRARCISTSAGGGVNDFTVIGGEFANATAEGFMQLGLSSGGRFFDCYSHDNGTNGFGASDNDAAGDCRFYGCIAETNGNDGFNAKGVRSTEKVTLRWTCYDCLAEDHDSGASTDGFTTHNSSLIDTYRCVSIGATKGWSYTHVVGRAVVANCFAVDCEMGFNHSGNGGVAGVVPSTLVYGSLFVLNGESQNSTRLGVSAQAGATVDSIFNSVYNPGTTAAGTDRCYSYAATDDANSNGTKTRMRVIGCVSEITTDTEAIHTWAFTPDEMPQWDMNLYRDIDANARYRVGNSLITKANWQLQADGLDASSVWYASSVFLGVPTSEASQDLARMQPGAFTVARMPSIKDYMESEGLANLWAELEILTQEIRALDADIHNDPAHIRKYRLTDSCAFMGLNGGSMAGYGDDWRPGCFWEGTKTTVVQLGATENGGVFIAAGHDNSGGFADKRVNLHSIVGDRTKQVVVKCYLFQSQSLTLPVVGNLSAGLAYTGHVVGLMMANSPRDDFMDRAAPPGEDLYLNIAAQAGIINVQIHYEIRDVKPVGVDQPGPNSYRVIDA